MSQSKLVVVYRCTHEYPDTDMNVERAKTMPYQFSPSIFTRLKRAITLAPTVRRPCMDLCPDCQIKKRVVGKKTSMAETRRATPSETFSLQFPQGMSSTPAFSSPAVTDFQPQISPQPCNMSEGPPLLPSVEALTAGWDAKTRREEKNPRGLSRSNAMIRSGLSPRPPPPPLKDSSAHARVHKWTKEQTNKAVKEHSEGLVSFKRFSDILEEERESPVDPALKGPPDKK
ncbi:hypothetical protein OCU04_009475 [Sclerotinia nivalis]|uniref:Uncharacterized protein n=1 Tax=Sclerotinia nivalis TaxID=352851 RepID=A0A9X0AG10_9HELO|nr:hypothetical protein OCU04_009475 [Sclerotinia nivalis]